MDLSGSGTRRAQRAVLALAAVTIGALAAVGITAPGTIRGALSGPEVVPATPPGPAVALCFSMEQDRWICNGTPEAPRPGLPLGSRGG